MIKKTDKTYQEYKQALGDKFTLITAFSREGPNKVYVQHRLQERAKEVNELLQQKAYFYVCGDAANMAREVNTVLAKIIAEQRGIPESKGEEIVKSMRAANQYQVCSRRSPLYSPKSSRNLPLLHAVPIIPFSSSFYETTRAATDRQTRNRRTCGHRNQTHAEIELQEALLV
jgi:hypothetical protein